MTAHEKRALRARIGMHLVGPLPTIAQIQKAFKLKSSSAACKWHVELVRARRQFYPHLCGGKA